MTKEEIEEAITEWIRRTDCELYDKARLAKVHYTIERHSGQFRDILGATVVVQYPQPPKTDKRRQFLNLLRTKPEEEALRLLEDADLDDVAEEYFENPNDYGDED